MFFLDFQASGPPTNQQNTFFPSTNQLEIRIFIKFYSASEWYKQNPEIIIIWWWGYILMILSASTLVFSYEGFSTRGRSTLVSEQWSQRTHHNFSKLKHRQKHFSNSVECKLYDKMDERKALKTNTQFDFVPFFFRKSCNDQHTETTIQRLPKHSECSLHCTCKRDW